MMAQANPSHVSDGSPAGRWSHRAVSRFTAHLTAQLTPWSTISPLATPYPLHYHQQLTCFQDRTRACPELVEGASALQKVWFLVLSS